MSFVTIDFLRILNVNSTNFLSVVKQIYHKMFVRTFYHLFIFEMPLEIQLSKGRVGIYLTGLTLPYFCACSKPWPGFQAPYAVFFFFWYPVS